MTSRALDRTFLVLYLTVGVVVFVQSVMTVVHAHEGGHSHHERLHAVLLGSLEAAAAVLFLIPRTMRLGAVVLLAIFAVAFAFHLLQGQPNLNLLILAAAVFYIRAHGIRRMASE